MNTTYEVTFTFTGRNGATELITSEFKTERAAVGHINHVNRMDGQELVSHSENIDRSAYRY